MSQGDKGPVFGSRARARGAGQKQAASRAKGKPGSKGSRPDRPLAEYREQMERRKGHKTLRQRLAGSFPWFGVIGVRELGLAVTILSVVSMMFWNQKYLRWSIVGSIVGIVIMRYGEEWLGGGK